MRAHGAAAVNIIPDRNCNVPDAKEREIKQANLKALIAAAEALEMPVLIGTEMNRVGQPLVDDLSAKALRPYQAVFARGARVVVGHMLLTRFAHFPYLGPAADAEFPQRKARNAFFEAVGGLAPLDEPHTRKLDEQGPRHAYAWFHQLTRHPKR